MNMPLLKYLIALFALCCVPTFSAQAGWKVGDALPDLSQQQLEGDLPGSLKGKVILVDFWASWCGPCAESFPVMEELHKRYGEQGLVVLAVNADEKRANMEKFLKKRAVTFAIVRDAAQKLVAQADVTTMPMSFLVDRDGKIAFVHDGYRGGETKKKYISEIESLLKGQP